MSEQDTALFNSYVDEMLALQLEIEVKKEALKHLKKNCIQSLGIKASELNDELKKYS